MVDDSLITPIEGQNILSIKSARDKDVNDKRKGRDKDRPRRQPQQDDAENSEPQNGNNSAGEGLLDFRA